MVRDYNDKTGGYTRKEEKAILNRVIFLYGTSYSQRENCIIGKVNIEISYTALRQFLSKQEAKTLKKEKKKSKGHNPSGSCFMHRETYINRKIPLNALLSVHVDRVSNLKESIENIEHFARIHQNVLDEDSRTFNEMNLQGVTKGTRNNTSQQIDRRRILTQILKNGLNLTILSSMFDEDAKLKEKFPDSKQSTRMLYNSLNPVFGESY